MDSTNPAGARRLINGRPHVFYDGYWIKAYEVPADTLAAKKRLIEALARRLFNHVEHGLDIPGRRLDEARRAFDAETDPERQRVRGAMLAGALFNRAVDVFTKLVELQELGVIIEPDNALMRECGHHLQEALVLGRLVRHRSGEEGIDELWGEPFKAFAFPIEDFYRSRYIKIAQTMRAIDELRDVLTATFARFPVFEGVGPLLAEFAEAARVKCETLRTDEDMFDVWTSFIVAGERLERFQPLRGIDPSGAAEQWIHEGQLLLRRGKELVTYIARARVPMPKTTREHLERCERYRVEAEPYLSPAARGAAEPVARSPVSAATCTPSPMRVPTGEGAKPGL